MIAADGDRDYDITGLSEREADSRRPRLDQAVLARQERRRFVRRAAGQSVFTLFNVDLFGIAVIQYFLQNPGGVIGALFVILLNVSLNVFQQDFAKRRLDALARALKPRATVIRDGQPRPVPSEDIVEGDAIVLDPGDQLVVDGVVVAANELVVDESSSGGRPDRAVSVGETVSAGTFCRAGHALVRSAESGARRALAESRDRVNILLTEYTPLERITLGILRALFLLVAVFSILLAADAVIAAREIVSDTYREGFAVVFGAAPTSLFLILVIVYGVGLLRVMDRGALVYDSRTVEAMANASVLCASRSAMVRGLRVRTARLATAPEHVTERRLDRLLGSLVASTPAYARAGRLLQDHFGGEPMRTIDTISTLEVNGWQAAAFDDRQLRATLVLGRPEVLAPHLKDAPGPAERVLGSLEAPPAPEAPRRISPGVWQWIQRALSPVEELAERDTPEGHHSVGEAVLLLAYVDDPVALHDADGAALVPDEMIPLAYVGVSEAVRPEARGAMNDLAADGVVLKLVSSSPLESTVRTAEELGMRTGVDDILSGPKLAHGGERLDSRVRETSAFGELSVAQKALIVEALQSDGVGVAMLGHHVSDIAAMRQADIAISMPTAGAYVLENSAIVLLRESLKTLTSVLHTGQQIVNGALSTFKLYLSQVVAQLLIIAVFTVFAMQDFPYNSTQSGVVAAFTIAIPNMLLSVWAPHGMLTPKGMRRRLVRFFMPAAIATTLLSIAVFAIFRTRGADVRTAQLAVMWAMLLSGWVRVLLVSPPSRFWVGGEELRGDQRVWWLIAFSATVFALCLAIPFIRDLLKIDTLPSAADYLTVAVAVVGWTFALLGVWRLGMVDWAEDKVTGVRQR